LIEFRRLINESRPTHTVLAREDVYGFYVNWIKVNHLMLAPTNCIPNYLPRYLCEELSKLRKRRVKCTADPQTCWMALFLFALKGRTVTRYTYLR